VPSYAKSPLDGLGEGEIYTKKIPWRGRVHPKLTPLREKETTHMLKMEGSGSTMAATYTAACTASEAKSNATARVDHANSMKTTMAKITAFCRGRGKGTSRGGG
jgi:hypothetical protein